MNRIKDKARYEKFVEKINAYDSDDFPFSTAIEGPHFETLAAQLVDSVRRIEFLNHIGRSDPVANSRIPYSGSFNPFKGAIWFARHGQLEEAFWLVFLASITSKHKFDGWNLVEDLYGRFGQGNTWSWDEIQGQPNAFESWLSDAYPDITNSGRSRRFGNHRKFETLKPGGNGLGRAVTSFAQLANQFGSLADIVSTAQGKVGQNPEAVFAELYSTLSAVIRMGRLGKFDFLCNLSNLYLAPIYPDSCYISASTGPIDGARLLFGGAHTPSSLDKACVHLAKYLDISPQAVEDTLCNWQKSPTIYRFYRG